MLHGKMMKFTVTAAMSATVLYTSVFAVNVVSTTDVNVREQPRTDSPVITVMKKGTSTEKLGQSNGWVEIKVNGKTGYIYQKYLQEVADPATPTKSPTTNEKNVTITTSSLRVRSGAGSNYSTIGKLTKGQTATVVDTSGDWYKIKFGKGYGYISKQFAKEVTATSDKPTTPDKPSAPTTKEKTVTITASSLRVRSGAGSNYSTIGKLTKGQTATVVDTSGDWYKIKFGKGYGYISTKYTK